MTTYRVIADRDKGDDPYSISLQTGDRLVTEWAEHNYLGLGELIRIERPEVEEETPPMVAQQWELGRHAEKQNRSYADAWRYFESLGYDMSEVDPQY